MIGHIMTCHEMLGYVISCPDSVISCYDISWNVRTYHEMSWYVVKALYSSYQFYSFCVILFQFVSSVIQECLIFRLFSFCCGYYTAWNFSGEDPHGAYIYSEPVIWEYLIDWAFLKLRVSQIAPKCDSRAVKKRKLMENHGFPTPRFDKLWQFMTGLYKI